ncbi:MAG: hypothetical protein ACRED9_05615 [Caulobacteraceae bacterium]
MGRPLLLAALLALAASPALAQDAVPTAGGAGRGAPAAAPAPGPLTPDQMSVDDIGPLMGPCGPTGRDAKNPDKPDSKPHGEVFVGAGTRGYREAGGIVCQPIGANSSVTLSVDAAKLPAWRWGR